MVTSTLYAIYVGAKVVGERVGDCVGAMVTGDDVPVGLGVGYTGDAEGTLVAGELLWLGTGCFVG